jgi:hypothetical protein
VGAVSSDEHRGRCRNAAQATHDAQAGSAGSAELVSGVLELLLDVVGAGVLDPIPVGCKNDSITNVHIHTHPNLLTTDPRYTPAPLTQPPHVPSTVLPQSDPANRPGPQAMPV